MDVSIGDSAERLLHLLQEALCSLGLLARDAPTHVHDEFSFLVLSLGPVSSAPKAYHDCGCILIGEVDVDLKEHGKRTVFVALANRELPINRHAGVVHKIPDIMDLTIA